MIEVKQIGWWNLYFTGRDMMYRHHLERGFASEEFDPNEIEMAIIERNGAVKIIGALDGLQLVGYLLWWITKQFGTRTTVGLMGPWYIEPQFRQTGLAGRMVLASRHLLRDVGCRRLRVLRPLEGIWKEEAHLIELRA